MDIEKPVADASSAGDQKPTARPGAIILISANLFLLVVVVWAVVRFGSVRAAVGYYLRGEALLVDSVSKSFGTAAVGAEAKVSFRLTNRGTGALRVVGCEVPCGCMVPDGLPWVLYPNKSKDFSVTVLARKPARVVNYDLQLFTNNHIQPRIQLSVAGEIRDQAEPSSPAL